MSDTWQAVATERRALAEDLAGLSDEQWETRSLCEDWTVRQTLAHLTGAGSATLGAFLGGFAKAGFSFDGFLNDQIKQRLGGSPAETLANFRETVSLTKKPPGPLSAFLGEVIVHSEDIRHPLGISHHYDPELVRRVADFYQGSNIPVGAKSRIAGLAMSATDTSWHHGEGAEVSGRLISLLMAMSGRKEACADLAGPGVELLASR